jgi:citrate lyase acyl carrier protein
MEIVKLASAGTMESSDAYVEIEPAEALQIQLESVVQEQFGDEICRVVKEVLDEIGLIPISAHVAFAEMMEDLDTIIADYKKIGVKFLVMPYMAEEYRPINPEGFKKFLPMLNEVGKKIHEKIGYVLESITFELDDIQRAEFYRCLTLISERLEEIGNSSIDLLLKGKK